ncbi:MAG: tripartite tricarboxylate transporter substrate binding protein [Burkholderiales bacterium]|nr:tripartite tricarboxylate transporter substrate binding protein [Burkholderiales bacterium]
MTFHRAVAGAMAAIIATAAFAQDAFPARPVTLLVPYPAGGLSDVLARIVNNPLGKALGQTVIVDNVGGAGGAIAAQKVLSAPSDGYLLYQGSPNELILAPLAMSAVKFKSEDFRLVPMIGTANMAIVARKDLPANTADELVDYARKAAAEGKPLTYASVGNGSFYHLLGEQMSKQTGVAMTHVPYKGGAPAQQDLLGGSVDIFISPFGAPQVELANQGKLKFIAVLSPSRQNLIKNVPSVNESRQLKGFNHAIWTGYFVKRDTPEPVVQALHKAVSAVLADPVVRGNVEANNLEFAKPMTLAEAGKAYTDGIAQFRAIAKAINLQPQ